MSATRNIGSVLVANRGEVVARVLRTTRRLGMRTVAVYTPVDAQLPYLREVDHAVGITSYLDGAALIAAAQASGADAIHPGYGFLAESAEFADAVIAAGLVWIGPSPASMRAMGNKASAKRALKGSEVPVLPGYEGERQDDASLIAEAARIGFPLMIKAAAGGGGRGMRLVHDGADLEPLLVRARSEAQQAFGNGDLLLERAVLAPRHIEVQVFGDAHDGIVHVGERDCSVQRRHQKLIEESPSPAVDASLRARLAAAAVDVARACDYVGAGTVEFLLDRDGAFWFIEMNTRLQVEHPVTEAVAGVDLVEWQLLVASGAPLPLSQADIDARLARGGHAIEVRLCAEDPAQDFLPQSGTMGLWRRPASVRCEDAMASGQRVPADYDSMIAKLVAHAPTRAQARGALVAGLRETRALGLATNQDFLIACLDDPVFAAGGATTAFIDERRADIAAGPPREHDVHVVAAVMLEHAARARSFPALLAGWSNSAALDLPVRLDIDGVQSSVVARMSGVSSWLIGDGERMAAVSATAAGDDWLVQCDGRASRVTLFDRGDALCLRVDGRNRVVRNLSYAARSKKAKAADGTVRAPINGRVVSLSVAAGDRVVAGCTLLVIDAMKMEHAIAAPCAGTVHKIHTSEGAQVAPGLVLIEILETA